MTEEQRKKAWAAAQAIYDALETYGGAEALAAAIGEKERDYYSPEDTEILYEISSRLYTLHDEDMK